uniref:DUF19 domain-containing protein n=1 Tax=Angiostrongylus cantonensis TaxID=6313 RepID=A0A158P7P2_ANGCA
MFVNRWEPCSGSLYYVPRVSTDPKVFIDAGVRAWLGVFTSAKVLQDRSPAICFGLVNRLFYEMNMGLVEFYCEVINEAGLYRHGDANFKNVIRNMAMNENQRSRMNSLLQGVRLKTTEALLPDRNNCYRLAERHVTFVKVLRLCDKPQRYSKMLSEPMLMKFIKGVSREPSQHKKFVEDIFNMLEFDVADTISFLNAFKVCSLDFMDLTMVYK